MKYSKLAMISGVLGCIYSIYLLIRFGGILLGGVTSFFDLKDAIILEFIKPHIFAVIGATVFMMIGAFLNTDWAVLVGSILFLVAAIVGKKFAFFVLPMIILGVIGYLEIRKINTSL